MTLGVWVLVAAVVVAVVGGAWWTLTNGVFRGTHRVRGVGRPGSAGLETGAERPPRPAERRPRAAERRPRAAERRPRAADRRPRPAERRPRAAEGAESPSVLAGTAYDEGRGERATLLQFSSAFCAPCRATRRILADVARTVPGVAHVEVDAEHHLDLVRALSVVRTPTTLVLDAGGRELTRATGAPRTDQVLGALESAMA